MRNIKLSQLESFIEKIAQAMPNATVLINAPIGAGVFTTLNNYLQNQTKHSVSKVNLDNIVDRFYFVGINKPKSQDMSDICLIENATRYLNWGTEKTFKYGRK